MAPGAEYNDRVVGAYLHQVTSTLPRGMDMNVMWKYDPQKDMVFLINVNNGAAIHLYMKPNTFWMDRARVLYLLVPVDGMEIDRWNR